MGRKRPAMAPARPREAGTYRDLTAWIRDRYPQVTEHLIHHWVSGGLLPPASAEWWGFGQRSTVQHVDTGRQLVAICRYRFDDRLGRHDLIGAQLWLDDFAVDTDLLRAAIRREFQGGIGGTSTEETEDALPYRVARQAPVIQALPGLSYDERADVIEEVRLAAQSRDEPTRLGVARLARASHQAPDAVRAALKAMPALPTDLPELAARASDNELRSARQAFAALSSQTSPDQHRNGRTRARVRLGQFLSAFWLDAAHGSESRSERAPVSSESTPAWARPLVII